jgi:hypothetical protein
MITADEQRRRAELALDEAETAIQEAGEKGLRPFAFSVWYLKRRVAAVERQMLHLEEAERDAEEVSSAWPSGLRSRRMEGFRGRLLQESNARRNVRRIERPEIRKLGRKTRALKRAIRRTRKGAEAADRRGSRR